MAHKMSSSSRRRAAGTLSDATALKQDKKPPRKQRERERHRREILEAAERVFVRKGYHAATTDEIAAEAEFAVGTLYNFFRSKDELYWQVVEGIARDFMDVFERRIMTIQNPQDAIAALIELRLMHFEEHRGFFRIFFEALPGSRLDPARALPVNCLPLYDRYVKSITSVFARGIKDGCFDDIDPLYLTLCLEGIINAFVAYWSRIEPQEPLPVRIEKLTGAFLGRLRVDPQISDRRSDDPRRRRSQAERTDQLERTE